MRLDHYLASCGLGSRSDVKKIISKGHITVDGSTVKDSAFKINENISEVRNDGQIVIYRRFVYYMLNKPQGIISASKADLRNKYERCVVDLIEEKRNELFPVGRLDKDTEGLLLITNDGQLAHNLLSPKKHIDKTYYAELREVLSDEDRLAIERGINIGDDKPALPCRIEIIDNRRIYITIHEGRYHQIKRMLAAVGNEVLFLQRLSMGNLKLDESLKPGEYRELTEEEIRSIS